MTGTRFVRRVLKPVLFAACVLPAGGLAARAWSGDLTANPVEFVTHETGIWALRLLVATLAVTPLRRLTGWHALVRIRRMLGLFAFFYACLHVATYVVLDHFFAVDLMLQDVIKRPFVTAGFTAFVCLVPLALTSTQGWIRRLGGRRWQRLHRLIYVSAVAAVVHYLWLVKADRRPPLLYAAVVTGLLGARAAYRYWPLWWSWQSARRAVEPSLSGGASKPRDAEGGS